MTTIIIVIIIVIVIAIAWYWFSSKSTTTTQKTVVIPEQKRAGDSKIEDGAIEALTEKINNLEEEMTKCKAYILYLENELIKDGKEETIRKAEESVSKTQKQTLTKKSLI